MHFTVLQEMSLQGYFICVVLLIGFIWVIVLLHGIKERLTELAAWRRTELNDTEWAARREASIQAALRRREESVNVAQTTRPKQRVGRLVKSDE